IAINRHYEPIFVKNIIGEIGEVVLDVDNKGGVIKIKSDTPMEYEKVFAKPLYPNKSFVQGEYVYICGKENEYFLVDDKIPYEKEEIKFCPNCGASIEKENESFCQYCGIRLSQD
ncbi:MAG: zinc ribbon domain-containing protein, partial [Candidatus Helarchaeota archaeon]